MTECTHVGLVGVGLLGWAMAQRLSEKSIAVHGFDIDSQRRALLSSPCSTLQKVFDTSDIVLLSLPTSDISQQVLESAKLREDQTIIDTTTGEPEQMVLIGEQIRKLGARYAEATVAGSSKQMRDGLAVMFVGCDEQTRSLISPLIDLLSNRVFHLGDVGAASRFKLVHNLILGLNRAVLAEGLILAESYGFDLGRTLEILQETPAASGVMQTKGPKMVASDFETQARLSQHLKDVRLILSEAQNRGVLTPMSDVHRQLLERAELLGFGDADNSAVIEAFRKK